MPDSFIRPKTLRSLFNSTAIGAGLALSACAVTPASDITEGSFQATETDAQIQSLTKIIQHYESLSAGPKETVISIPARDGEGIAMLETTIYKPPGDGPFPVVVMNHGKALGNPKLQLRDRFLVLSKEFVKRGYAVIVPMRKGFSNSTGSYVEYGCDMTRHGQSQADDVKSALDYIAAQPWADKDRVIVAGQSYGGMAALALGSRDHLPGVKGIINFSGGLKVIGGSCDWQSSLVQAFASYGSKTSLPSLWFYGENDSHFDHKLAARLRDAYNNAGGKATLVAFGPFKKDAHGMVGSRDGPKIWWPETEKFLDQLGLPTKQVYAFDDTPEIPETKFAALDDVESVPNVGITGRAAYRDFLQKSLPRAFAVAPDGSWAWAEDGDDPVNRALALCGKVSHEKCTLYAVNDRVVWPAQPVMAGTPPAPAPSPAASAGR